MDTYRHFMEYYLYLGASSDFVSLEGCHFHIMLQTLNYMIVKVVHIDKC